MLSRRSLEDIIRTGFQLAEKLHMQALDLQQQRGLECIGENIKNGGLAVGVGPPGTGKTMVFSKAYVENLENIDSDEVIVHIAPTNRLVEETAERTIALLVSRGYDEKDLNSIVRVYGSHFEPKPLDKDVKLVFTTGYQPGALAKLSMSRNAVHVMIDEASTTAFHEAFISLSIALTKEIKSKRGEFIASFNVIGDPMQAIVEYGGSRWKYEHLIVYRMILSIIPEDERDDVKYNPSKMFELAEKYANQSEIGYFFLNKTYRMPKPTEILVSMPFYDEKLVAVRDYNEALKNILSDSSQINSFINRSHFLNRYEKVRETIDNALDSAIPIVYIVDRDGYKKSRYGGYLGLDEYDDIRTKLGSEIAAYLAYRTTVQKIMLLAPYNDIVQQAHWYTRRSFGDLLEKRLEKLSFRTVHSALGSEADIIVAILGKEYIGETHETIYFQIPELINVQFSRHFRMLVIIGDVEKLADNMNKIGGEFKHVSRIKNAIEKLKEKDLIKITKINN